VLGFARRDPEIGPAPRSRLAVAWPGAALLLAVFVVAGLAYLLTIGHRPEAPPVTSVELALPAGQPGSSSSAVAIPSDRAAEFEKAAKGGDPALIEPSASGPLPMVADDGRKAWQVYAKPFDRTDRRPRIAIVVVGLGLAVPETQAAIERLPGAMTLAFNSYATDLPEWLQKARGGQHEVVLTVPMEPVDYPREDPGPQTLLTALTPRQNLDRLEWTMGRAAGYVGLTNLMGSRFLAAATELRPILEVIKGRGLLFLETRAANQTTVAALSQELALPEAVSDRDLDGNLSPAGIDQALAELEPIARRKGTAVGTGSPYPLTIDRLVAWAAGLESKGLVLAPLSAVIAPPPDAKAEAKEAQP
jgi:polysaccharide deacetylase 2 family uncharacterized protein YibQ